MFRIGRVCIKTAGRDASNRCVIIDNIDDNYVLIDGQTRRRKCNVKHLEPTEKVVNLKKNASGEAVKKVFKQELNLDINVSAPKQKKKGERPRKQRKKKPRRKKAPEEKKPKEKKAGKQEQIKKEKEKPKDKKKQGKSEKKQ